MHLEAQSLRPQSTHGAANPPQAEWLRNTPHGNSEPMQLCAPGAAAALMPQSQCRQFLTRSDSIRCAPLRLGARLLVQRLKHRYAIVDGPFTTTLAFGAIHARNTRHGGSAWLISQ